MNKMLDQQVAWANAKGLIKGQVAPVALDSSMFESHHVSRHFENRCRHSAKAAAKAARLEKNHKNKG